MKKTRKKVFPRLCFSGLCVYLPP